MKLLENFKQQLQGLGPLKRVWLTTFNLDIAFVETWVLPALLRMEPPVSRMDYEGLQRALTESGIDFRLYCDPRMVARDKPKRTSIQVYPVSVRQLAQGEAPHAHYLDDGKGLFHPKVFYLEDKDRNVVVGAGSANLTLSGWGRNQEAVDFRRLSSNKQFQQVKQFFTAIDPGLADQFLARRHVFADDDVNWSFIHSLGGPTLMQALQPDADLKNLSVWSPYLAADMAGFIKKLVKPEQRIELVPDLVAGRHIRTRWEPAVQTAINEGQLTLCHAPVSRDERSSMTHAKLWLGHSSQSKYLAVGSWNFTAPGCCSLFEKGWNVEAGIVHPVARNTVLCGPAWSQVNENDFADEALLKDEALEVEALPPCDLSVMFDWTRSEYLIDGEWFNGKAQPGHELILPGIAGPSELVWKKNGTLKSPLRLPLLKSAALLNTPFYTLRMAGRSVWQGMIVEINTKHRRALNFPSLDDLLNSYLTGTAPDNDERLILRSSIAQDQTQSEGEAVTGSKLEPTSYFRLFQAVQHRRELLTAETDIMLLYRRLFTEPGCLLELAEFTRERVASSTQSVFKWFLAQEVNSLAVVGKRRFIHLRNAESETLSVAAHQWASLNVLAPELTGDTASEHYLTAIRESCGYGA